MDVVTKTMTMTKTMTEKATVDEEVRQVRWSKESRVFVPIPSEDNGQETQEMQEKQVDEASERLQKHAGPPGADYVGNVNVGKMSTAQVQQFFSRDIFNEERMMTMANPGEIYVKLCSGINFEMDKATLGKNRRAVEMFLECYGLFLQLLVRILPHQASEFLRCATIELLLGQFNRVRALCQAFLATKPLIDVNKAKEMIVQARKCEATLQHSKKRSTMARNLPSTVVNELQSELDEVLRVAPHCREALHVKVAIWLSMQDFPSIVDLVAALPIYQLDIHMHVALGRALDYTGHSSQAIETLKKLPLKQFPLARNELLRLQEMDDKRKKAITMARGGHHTAALDAFSKCLELDPNHRLHNAGILFDRAESWMAIDKPNEAIRDLEKCIELNPSHPVAPARLQMARAQVETLRLKNQMYKEQRANDKFGRKDSSMNVFFRFNHPTNVSLRDHLAHMSKPDLEQSNTKRQPKFSSSSLEPMPDLYTILGVSTCASIQDIKKAYHRLALQLHPDKNPVVGMDEHFKAIAMAYSILSNPDTRAQYDAVSNSTFYT